MSRKISFCIPAYHEEDVIERCLKSLLAQDYKNMEIIVCFDGGSEEGKKIVSKLAKKYPEIPLSCTEILPEHRGACAARNKAYSLSTGEPDDLVSFLSADYVMLPGGVRQWIEAFEDYPEADMIYSGYNWTDHTYPRYESEEYDLYKLQCYNFIDGAFPLKRKYFLPHDENCKSLNDWEWVLRLCLNGIKPKYIKDIAWEADLPKPKGLSYDSSANWIERRKYVLQQNNIPLKDIVIYSAGAQQHALNVAKMLNIDYGITPMMKANEYKMAYMLGLYTGPNKSLDNFKVFHGGLPKNARKTIHWVGAGIYWLRAFSWAEIKRLAPLINRTYTNLVESEQTREEMESYGIHCKVVPIPPPTDFKVMPLPDDFTVAIMKTNSSDFGKYCGDLMDDIIHALPFIKFKVFGDGKCNKNLPNVENCGQVKMEEFVPQCSAILRITRHDSMMMACNEFVMAGRDAITNFKQPYMEYIDTWIDRENWDRFGMGLNLYNYPTTKAKVIEKIIELWQGKAGNKDREEASKYYRDLLDKQKYKDRIFTLAKQVYTTECPARSPIAIGDALRDVIKDKVVCDIGCSEGDTMITFSKYADKVMGVEIRPEPYEIAKNKGLNVQLMDALTEDIPDADVYYIWSNHTSIAKAIIAKLPKNKIIVLGGDVEVGERYPYPVTKTIVYDEGKGVRQKGLFELTILKEGEY